MRNITKISELNVFTVSNTFKHICLEKIKHIINIKTGLESAGSQIFSVVVFLKFQGR